MSDAHVASADGSLPVATSRQAIEAKGRSAPRKVTGKLKVALDCMVWEGSRRDDAAKVAGMAVHGLREALRKPHVKAYYRAQLDVLRESERARNIHALVGVRDQTGNAMARVNAVKELEAMVEHAAESGVNRSISTPGVAILIVNQASGEAKPLLTQHTIDAVPVQRDTASHPDAPAD